MVPRGSLGPSSNVIGQAERRFIALRIILESSLVSHKADLRNQNGEEFALTEKNLAISAGNSREASSRRFEIRCRPATWPRALVLRQKKCRWSNPDPLDRCACRALPAGSGDGKFPDHSAECPRLRGPAQFAAC